MKLSHCIAITVLLGSALAGCQSQRQQASPPSPPSSPGTLPSPPSSTSPGSSQGRSGDTGQAESSPQSAEQTYGARSGSETAQPGQTPAPGSEPGGNGEESTQQEILEVLAEIDVELEKAASNPDITPEQAEAIEQYRDVLESIEASVQNGDLDPASEEALLEVLADLEQTLVAARESAEQGDHSIPVTITVTQVAVLQDIIDILGLPGALPGIELPSIPAGVSRSDEQTLGDLDATLEASIGVFDGMILSERVSAQGKPGDEEVYAGGGEGVLFEEGTLGEDGADSDGDQQAEAPEMPGGQQPASNRQQRQSRSGAGGAAQRQATAIPDDIPDGRDDDIVARQLREAALNEQDPELREKLWEEYRRYKQGK